MATGQRTKKITKVFDVAGCDYRVPQCTDFAEALERATKENLEYGIDLIPEPTNEYDRNAIKVIGYADRKKLVFWKERQFWHIGYIPRKIAKELNEQLVTYSIPIFGELVEMTTYSWGPSFSIRVYTMRGQSFIADPEMYD